MNGRPLFHAKRAPPATRPAAEPVSREIGQWRLGPQAPKAGTRLIRLAEEQARAWSLGAGAGERFAALLARLERDPAAPTGVRSPADAASVHLADSLAALDLACVRSASSIADVGSGAGFPGLPLAVALPSAGVALLESVTRKAAWLMELVGEVGVLNAAVINARAEAWPDGIARHDLVTARAVDALPVLVEYAAPLLRLGGSLVAWKGRRAAVEERDGAAAADRLGMRLAEVRYVEPYAGSRDRHLHVYEKVGETPEGYPRAPGRARKRPIVAAR